MQLPIAPSKINTVINGRNQTIELLNGQEINVIKPKGLTEVSFEFMIPSQGYPFASLTGQLANVVGNSTGRVAYDAMEIAIKQYLEYLKTGGTSIGDAINAITNTESNGKITKGEPFQFIVIDIGRGGMTVKGNLKVTLESYEIIEDADSYGLDTMVSVTLKQYVPYSTKILGSDGKITKTRGK